MQHLTTLCDLTTPKIEHIFSITEDLKTKYTAGLREPLLPGRVMALLFEKPSLRTRVSFESGMSHLGGTSLMLGPETGFGKQRESLGDFGRVLSQYVDVIVCRAKSHDTVVELARHATCSVINGLTDWAHPCQALADLYTLRECAGSLDQKKMAYVGDGNNVARSLALACGMLGVRMALAAPAGYQFDEKFLALLKSEVPKLELEMTEDPVTAVAGADAVYTDVWASMGQEKEKEERRRVFAAYQVNTELIAHAPEQACFMHCLPAHRGEEVTDQVMDSPASVVVQQAANRMHVQKGILAWLLGGQA